MELVVEIRESHLNFVYGERTKKGIIKIKENFSIPFVESYAPKFGRELNPVEMQTMNINIKNELKNRNIKKRKSMLSLTIVLV